MPDLVERVLGLGADALSAWQMAVRAVIVYAAALTMVRLGEKRFLGKSTAFDVILGVILGSVVSRAITGQSPFFPTLAAGFVLVGLHWVLAWAAFRSDWFGRLVKGTPRTLVQDGEIRWDAMRASHVSDDDLRSALRSQGGVEAPEAVKAARLERSGKISVLPRESDPDFEASGGDGGPRVVEVRVADGVQYVRIELG